jgi:hypothetical protein
MTVYQAAALLLALLTLSLAGINTLKAWRHLRAAERDQVTASSSDVEEKGALPPYSPVGVAGSLPAGPPPTKATILAAWNELPVSAISAYWTNFALIALLLGL